MAGSGSKRLTMPIKVPDEVRLAGLLVAGVALQTVVSSRLEVFGVIPDLFLILVIAVAIGRGSYTGAIFGFAAGLVADVVFLDPVGLRTFVSLVAGYAIGRYSEELGLSSAWMLILLVGAVALVTQGAYGLLQFVLGHPGSFLGMFWEQVLPSAVLDALLAPPVYLGLARLGVVPALEGSSPSFR
jgi:rod shape-determining protein MreD